MRYLMSFIRLRMRSDAHAVQLGQLLLAQRFEAATRYRSVYALAVPHVHVGEHAIEAGFFQHAEQVIDDRPCHLVGDRQTLDAQIVVQFHDHAPGVVGTHDHEVQRLRGLRSGEQQHCRIHNSSMSVRIALGRRRINFI